MMIIYVKHCTKIFQNVNTIYNSYIELTCTKEAVHRKMKMLQKVKNILHVYTSNIDLNSEIEIIGIQLNLIEYSILKYMVY